MTNRTRDPIEGLRRTAAVAADYEQMQGLVTATIGVTLVIWALGSSTWAAIVIVVGIAACTSYYRKRFGGATSRHSVPVAILYISVAFVLCLIGFVVDQRLAGPVLVLPLVAALCLVALYRWGYPHTGVTPVHWLAVAMVALSALAPAFGLELLHSRTGPLIVGVALILIGAVDHVRLMGAMKPVPRD